jgi:hypothetical protein
VREHSREADTSTAGNVDEDRDAPAPGGGLAELIELERRVEAELAAAEVESVRVLESAQQEARARREASNGALDAALRSLREQTRRASADSQRAIEARAEAEVARYEQVDERTVEALGRFVAARINRGDVAR